MATDTVASDYTSPTDEQVEKTEKEEGSGEKSVSLCSENEDEDDKSENDSLALGASGEQNLKDDKDEDAQEDKKVDPAVVEVEKTNDSPSSDKLKEEKELIPESQPQGMSVTETASETPQQPETGEEKQPDTPDILEALIESEAETAKDARVQENSEEPEKEYQQKGHEEPPNTDATQKSLVDATEETTREPEFNAETGNYVYEAGPTETSAKSTEKPGYTEVERTGQSKEPGSADVKKNPIQHIGVAEQVKEQSKDVEAKQVLVGEIAKSEGTSDDETGITGNTALVSAQIANEVESSSGIAEEDGKKELRRTDVTEGVPTEAGEELSRETVVAETTKAEEGPAKVERVKDAKEKEGHAERKVDEITVRETLASKLKEKEEESITTEADKLEKEKVEISHKPSQKQSINIIAKVKQSLVRAKKAITGKSPSYETKADFQLK